MILDDLNNANPNKKKQEWNFISDQVMGGISSGEFEIDFIENIKCYRMTGEVSTKNNGGFIQIRTNLIPELDSKKYDGIYFNVYGNNNKYSLHLRSNLTFAPWQFYSYSFFAPKKWIKIKAPLKDFKKSNFYQPKNIRGQNIKSVGLVAGFDDFRSDICLSEIGFY